MNRKSFLIATIFFSFINTYATQLGTELINSKIDYWVNSHISNLSLDQHNILTYIIGILYLNSYTDLQIRIYAQYLPLHNKKIIDTLKLYKEVSQEIVDTQTILKKLLKLSKQRILLSTILKKIEYYLEIYQNDEATIPIIQALDYIKNHGQTIICEYAQNPETNCNFKNDIIDIHNILKTIHSSLPVTINTYTAIAQNELPLLIAPEKKQIALIETAHSLSDSVAEHGWSLITLSNTCNAYIDQMLHLTSILFYMYYNTLTLKK